MAAHRYWRIRPTANSAGITNGDVRIQDIEFRTSAGGADVTGSGTASANSNYSGETAANAFDSVVRTYWRATLSTTQWIKYDFGAGQDKDIVEVAIAADAANPGNAPATFFIEWSDDNTAWTTWGSYSGITGWYAGQRRTFQASGEVSTPTVPASARFWRIVATALQAGNTFTSMRIGEMQLRSSAGGADLTGSGTAIGGTNQTGGLPANAFDNNTTTEFMSNADSNTWWLGYDFGSGVSHQIVEFVLQAEDTSATTAPTAFILQRSSDGHGWNTNDSYSGQSWTAGETKTFSISQPASSARPVVFVCT